MRRRSRFTIVSALLAAALAVVGLRAQTPQTPPQTPQRPIVTADVGAAISLVDYCVGPRDTLQIEVANEAMLPSRSYTVATDGTIFLLDSPTLRALKVEGLTAQGIREAIKAAIIKDGLRTDATVFVDITGFRSQNVTVNGEVRTPGQITLTADRMTLNAAIAAAGGLTTDAAPEMIVRREKQPGEPGTLNPNDASSRPLGTETQHYNYNDLKSAKIDDVVLLDNDFVFVPKADKILVTGEVANPQSLTLTPGMTVIEAINKAGGLKPTGAMNRVSVKRYDHAKATYVEVKGVKPTTLLMADDTVNVPKKRIG